jgi:hypothetical protein
MVFDATKVEGAISALGKSQFFTLKLCEQALQRHVSARKNAQVAVHGKDKFIGSKGIHSPNRNRFLSPSTKPLGYPALTKENQHFFFDSPRNEQGFV